jgi:hypothetical protein
MPILDQILDRFVTAVKKAPRCASKPAAAQSAH